MEEEKDIIEENNKIEESDDIVSEDETDENVIEESDEEENDESEEDKFDETRKIDFANKNEVYQDFFDEKKKSKFGIVLVVIFILVLIGVGCYFVYIYRDKIFNKFGNVVDNMDALVDVNKDDDNDKENISTSSDDVEEKILNVYQKGSDSVVVFTYKCKSKYCDIIVNNDSFILYDDKVYHRDMTAYELEQINNTEKTPTKSELSFNGFEEVNSVSVELGGVEELNDLYQMHDEYYIVSYDTILKSDDYNKNSDRCEGFYKVEDIIILDCFTYNYKEKIEINFTDHLAFTVLDYGYKNGFYYFYTNTSEGNPIYVFRGNGEDVKLLVNNFYINDDKLYYLGFDGKINVVNNKGEVLPFNNDGIKGITIFEDRLIYLNSDNVLSVKNILDDDNYYSTDVKLQNPYLFGKNNGFQILDPNKSVLEEEGFESYRKQQNINDEEFSKIKKCIADSESCEEFCYMVGNMVNLDKNGKLVSKEYYLDISQFCME